MVWVPGCTSAVQVDESTYRAHLEQQVGFLKASFEGLELRLEQAQGWADAFHDKARLKVDNCPVETVKMDVITLTIS